MLKLPIQRGYTSSKDVFGYIRFPLCCPEQCCKVGQYETALFCRRQTVPAGAMLRLHDHDILDAGRVT